MILACPFCKAKADPAAVNCTSCGKTMSRACPACAETVGATSTTCKYCGEALPAMKAAAPATCDTPGIVFLDAKPRKRSCCGAGRTMFWMMVLALAGFCAYSVVRAKIHVHHHQSPTMQQADPKEGWH